MSDFKSLLESTPELNGATALSALSGGPVSDSWLADIKGSQYVIRLDNNLADKLKLDRFAELKVLEIVAQAGIGPDVYWASPDQGVLVTRYLPGEAWTKNDIHKPQNLVSLAKLLRRLHDLPAQGREFNPAAAVKTYAKIIGTRDSELLATRAEKLAGELLSEQYRPSLCHNDLVHMNIVDKNPVKLIDWEYAAMGDPLFDLAIVVRHHGLSSKAATGFLQSWSPAADSGAEDRFQAFCLLYDMLSELWYQATSTESPR